MKLTMTAGIVARWGHRVDGLVHTHAWTLEATVGGPVDAPMVMPVDDLEKMLCETVAPWDHHYLTHEDVGEWKGYRPLVWELEPTVEEIARHLWAKLDGQVAGLESIALTESTEFDRCRTVRLEVSPV